MNRGDIARFRHAPIFSTNCGEIDPLDPLEAVRVVGWIGEANLVENIFDEG